jgi:hypothetical protein
MEKLGIHRMPGYFDRQIVIVDLNALDFGRRNVNLQTQF